MSNAKIFGFRKQFDAGNIGEQLFIDSYSKEFNPQKGGGRVIDIILSNGKTVELKTDSYDMEKTQNMFIEHFGNTSKKTLGGPWRAFQDNIDYFVYLYSKQKIFFWFNPKELANRVDALYNGDRVNAKFIKNPNYETMGYLVNRKDLEDIVIRTDNFGENPFQEQPF